MTAGISIHLAQQAFAPGAYAEGVVRWSDVKVGMRMRLALIWRTEGKGTTDTNVEHEQEFTATSANGERNFGITLPESPYSFHGQLISLLWRLELSAGSARVCTPLTISPHTDPIDLPLLYEGSR